MHGMPLRCQCSALLDNLSFPDLCIPLQAYIHISGMSSASHFQLIFERAVMDYHIHDDVDASETNPFDEGSFEALIYRKNWIDTVQWHLEDIVRDPAIDPARGMEVKRRIDRSNQQRTDLVEAIDERLMTELCPHGPATDAPLNTETPAWAIDRLSILALKIYHMRLEAERPTADESHRAACRRKLEVLLEQRSDLIHSIDDLLSDIAAGRKRMRLYKQMKMYNDASLNPVLYRAGQS